MLRSHIVGPPHRLRLPLPAGLFLVATLVAGACKSSEPAPPPTFDAVTKEESEALGKRFATLLDRCTTAELAPLWNAEVTAARAVQDAKADSAVKEGLLAAFTSERLWDGQCQSLAAGGASRNKYLGLREEAGSWRPIVRMLSSSGLNYAEFELGRFPQGVLAVDATYYLTGEPLSRTLSRLLGSAQSAIDDGDLGDGTAMERISAKQRAGDAVGALALIAKLPPALRNDKSIMLLEIGLDPGDDEARYLGAIERFEKAFPGDPALDLVSIDGFFLRKQFDRLHGSLDRLDKRVNDPYLDVMRALAYFEAKDFANALKHIKRAIEREPDLQDAWDTKSSVCLAQKDYACAVEALKMLNDKFSVPVTDDAAAQLDNGAELIASEPWKAWRATVK